MEFSRVNIITNYTHFLSFLFHFLPRNLDLSEIRITLFPFPNSVISVYLANSCFAMGGLHEITHDPIFQKHRGSNDSCDYRVSASVLDRDGIDF